MLAVLGVLFGGFAICPPARAGEAPPQAGIIVSIRGDILEIQPAWLTGHQRLLVDPKTPVIEQSEVPLAKIPVGARIVCYGRGDLKSGLTAFYIAAGDLRSEGVDKQKLIGVMNSQWGVYWGGSLKSADPLVITDDAGTDIKADVRSGSAHYSQPASMDDIIIGRKISYESDKTNGGIHHVTSLAIESTPGKAGVVFATVVSRKARTLTVVPRFGSTPVDIVVLAKARVQRQVTLDPDHVAVGKTISAWGVPAQGGGHAVVAYALMSGAKMFPIASSDGPDRSVVGRVTSLEPFTLRDAKAEDTVLYITGQTPLVDIAPSSLDKLRAGDPVMLLVSKAPGGATTTDYVLVDASPILAFAFAD